MSNISLLAQSYKQYLRYTIKIQTFLWVLRIRLIKGAY